MCALAIARCPSEGRAQLVAFSLGTLLPFPIKLLMSVLVFYLLPSILIINAILWSLRPLGFTAAIPCDPYINRKARENHAPLGCRVRGLQCSQKVYPMFFFLSNPSPPLPPFLSPSLSTSCLTLNHTYVLYSSAIGNVSK